MLTIFSFKNIFLNTRHSIFINAVASEKDKIERSDKLRIKEISLHGEKGKLGSLTS